MANSMQHWNGHQMAVIDIETTGLDPAYDEIIQICILPVDSNIDPRQDIYPFNIEIIPEYPHRIDPKAMSVNRKNLADIMRRGFDSEKAKGLLEEWVEKLGLPYTKYGNRKRIMPIAQNWQFDYSFIIRWLGPTLYSEIFDSRYRDTQAISLYLNDRAGMAAEQVPFSKNNLAWLCSKLKVENTRQHDALSDCIATAQIYKKLLMNQGWL